MRRDLKGHASPHPGEGKRGRIPKKVISLFLILLMGLFFTRCAAQKEEIHAHGDMAPVKTYPKDYVHPLAQINLQRIINENRGLKVFEENATTVHDYYRGGVQEKAEGEKFFTERKWEEARGHFEKSNRFLLVVLKYLPEDEAYRNIYGDHTVIFLPNLLIADNYLRLSQIYHRLEMENKISEAEKHGRYYLDASLKSVKTEWGYAIQKGFEAFPGK